MSVALPGGEPIAVGGNRPVIVSRPGEAWLVEAGRVDLFVTQVTGGAPVGARRFVMRVGQGGLICGLDLDAAPSQLAVIAYGADGTSLRPVGWPDLACAAPHDPFVQALVERWIADLSASVALGLPPRRATALEAAGEQKLEQDAAAIVFDGVLWTEVREGRCAYQGRPDVFETGTGDPPALLPVSRAAWLRATAPASLVSRPLGALTADEVDRAVSAFHTAMARALVRRLLDADDAERGRLRRQSALDREAFSQTLRGLAASIGADTEAPPAAAPGPDGLLRACEIAVRPLGVTVRRPARMEAAAHFDGGLGAIAEASGLRTRRVLLAGTWWQTYGGPLLAWMSEDRRPVALTRRRRGGYELHDVGRGTVQRVDAAVASSLVPRACAFYRSFPNRALTVADVVRFGLIECRRDVLMVLAMAALGGLLGTLTPIVTGVIFDQVIPGAMRASLWGLCAALLAAAVASSVFQAVRSVALIRLETRTNVGVQAAVWDRLMRAPVPFFRRYNAGDLAVRALGIDAIRQTITGSAISSILSGTFSLFSVALLFYYSWRLALPALGMVLLACLVTLVLGYRQVRYRRELTRVQGRIAGLVLQIISGVAKFRVAGAERRAFANWGRAFGEQKRVSTASRRTGNRLAVFNAAYPLFCTGLIFFFVYRTQAAHLSTGSFLAFNAAFGQLLASMLAVCATAVAAAAVVPYYERARPILATLPEVTEGTRDPGDISGAVDASHIRFRYKPDGPLILDDVSISAAAGEFVALVGPSGCGKSTFFRVLLGFERPESGAIYYDGQRLSDLDVQALRRQMGVVLQNGRLVAADILTNIIGAAPNLTADDAWEAARLAGLDQDIASMPMGMYTMVSEGGGGLSGGQRQRLMVARALVRRPRILLFDEATSALDNQTQSVVSRSIEQLRATRIVIAHRASTVQHADRIYVFDNGRVVESGRFDELLQAGGRFAQLVRRQLA